MPTGRPPRRRGRRVTHFLTPTLPDFPLVAHVEVTMMHLFQRDP